MDNPPLPSLGPSRLVGSLAPVILLGVFLILAVTSLARKNATFDEVSHIPAGYASVRTGEFRLNPEHPPLAKLLAGLPLLSLGLGDPRDLPEYAGPLKWEGARQWEFGRALLYGSAVPANRIVFWARIPLVLLTAALGLFVYRWSREIHGEAGGLLSLCLFAFSPNLLAHGRLVTTDALISLFSLLASYHLWRNLVAPPGRSWLPYSVALALAFLTKYSAVVLLPGVGGIVLVWLLLEKPPREAARQVLRKFAVATALPLVLVLAFGFGPARPFAYLAGFQEAFAKLSTDYPFYLAGRLSKDGFYSYYVVAFLLKTPIPTLLLIAASLLTLRKHPRVALAAILVPAFLFFLAPTLQRYNIGIRYVLPVFPFLFVLAGGSVRLLSLPQRRLYAVTGAVLLGWLAMGTVLSYPHYIPYFNEIGGGPKGGIRWLDDSNIDWGQDLMALGKIAREEGFEGMGVLYHGMALPKYYLPDSYVPPDAEILHPRRGQVYAVSAQMALRMGWLQKGEPFRTVGHSIYLYRFPE